MIRLQDVSFRYFGAAKAALQNISFELAPGELLLCVGQSGCGKSTLAKVINGLAPHYTGGSLEGSASVFDIDIKTSSPSLIAESLGSLFQDPERQFFALTVREEIAFSLEWRSWEPKKIEEAVNTAIELMEIEDIVDSSILALSEGQKQKVAIASLLAGGAKALVLDEPSANLDPEAMQRLADILAKLKQKGFILVLIDHRLAWLRNLTDKVLVLEEGTIAHYGDASLLDDAELRNTYGLRGIEVTDTRGSLHRHVSFSSSADGKASSTLAAGSSAEGAGSISAGAAGSSAEGAGSISAGAAGSSSEGDGSISIEAAEPLFCCKELSFAYPKKAVLFKNMSLSFRAGDIVALLGPNGSGKTTLAKLFTGIEKAHSGAFFARGKQLKAKELNRHVQVVLQNASHQLRMSTVRGELLDALSYLPSQAEREEKLYASLSHFSLDSLAERHPQSLSGGEMQRLAIAVSLVRQPELLFLDEPTSGLDGKNMLLMAAAIQKVAEQGTSVVLITHDLELIARLCSSKIELPYSN